MNQNSKDNFNAVIDLTESCSLAILPRYLANTVIDLLDTTDESFNTSIGFHSDHNSRDEDELFIRKSDGVTKKSTKTRKRISNCGEKCPNNGDKKEKRLAYGLGDCPICWDQLGKNPLASTKCGHIYCFKCLEQVLKIEKKCPTCRCLLKGTSDFHPLYF